MDFYYGGLRPLVEDRGEAKSTYNTSRKTEILDHKESGFPGFFTAMGGKYTTSRSVGEAVVDKVADYLPGNFRACETSETPPSTGNCSDLLSLTKELGKKFPKLNGKSIETIAFRYGLQAYQILEKNFSKEEFYTLQNGEKFFESEVRFIANREDIRFATDFFFRRSGVGVPGLPEEKETTKLVRSLAKYLGWNQNRISKEIKAVKERYRIY
ncbi:hypothetical protein JQK62_13700 [Leptospira santarosai]|nr:hypothetical protein [Leptospira santarosai]